MKDIKTEADLENLIGQIKDCAKPYLSFEKKFFIKKNLMNKLDIVPHVRQEFSLYSLIGAIRLIAEKMHLSPAKRAYIKENIMESASLQVQKRFFWSNFFTVAKKLASATLVLVLAFSLFSFMNIQTTVVRASTFTTLDSFSGGVLVERNGLFVNVSAGMRILEHDQLITGPDGTAVIRYFDDSVSRLAGDTKIVINKLRKPVQNSVDSYVEVSLVDGNLWSRVINLVEAKSAFVVKAMNVYASAKKAAFNVEVDRGKLEIGVFNRAVDVHTNKETERVISGEKFVVDNGAKQIKVLAKKDKNDDWVKDNLEDDKQYLGQVEQQLLEAKRKAVGLEKDKDISLGNSLREDALLFLTFDDVKKKKLALDLAERDFVAAQIKLHDDLTPQEKIEAQAAMQNFSDQVKDFYKVIDEVAYTDKVYADELKAYVDAKVLIQKKDLSIVLPDSPTYAAKKVIDEVELLSADNEAEVLRLKVDQASEKLALAEDVKNSGNTELASQVVEEYQKDMTSVVKLLDNLDEVQPGIKEEVAEKVSDNIALLKAIDVMSENKVDELQEIVTPVVADQALSTDLPAPVDLSIVVAVPVTSAAPSVDQTESVVDGPYGVRIKGDKPLPPLLQDI